MCFGSERVAALCAKQKLLSATAFGGPSEPLWVGCPRGKSTPHSDVLPSSSRRGPQVAARSEFFMISADIRIETLRHRRYLRVAHPIEEIEWTVEGLVSGAMLWRRPSRRDMSQPSGVQGLGPESWRASSPRCRPAFRTLEKPKSGGGP